MSEAEKKWADWDWELRENHGHVAIASQSGREAYKAALKRDMINDETIDGEANDFSNKMVDTESAELAEASFQAGALFARRMFLKLLDTVEP